MSETGATMDYWRVEVESVITHREDVWTPAIDREDACSRALAMLTESDDEESAPIFQFVRRVWLRVGTDWVESP